MELTFRPITTWPGKPTASRKRSQFSATHTATLGLLDRELTHLRAKNVVLQVALSEADIRLDGRPRAGSRVAHPGVILSFDSRHGPLSYPCDAFTDWEANLRAIALSLEHLRAVDRYGVTKRGEQYQGWTALPPPASKMTRPEAVGRLCGLAGWNIMPIGDDQLKAAYRAAVMRHHPDRAGDAEKFKLLQEIKDILGIE